MAYSVMVWLVDPGEQAHQSEAMQRTTTGRSQAPGAASGVNEPPAFTRMVYGVYESLDEAKKALSEISNKLRENEPLKITSGAESTQTGSYSSPPIGSTTSSALRSSGRGIGGAEVP